MMQVRVLPGQPSGRSTIISMLPFIKGPRTPRMPQKPMEDKLVQGSEDDLVEDHCLDEIFQACESKDIGKLRSALEFLVINCFEPNGDKDATNE